MDTGTVHYTLHKLGYNKDCVQWVYRLRNKNACEWVCFTEYSQNGNDHLLSIMASNENWCFYFETSTNGNI